MILDPCSDVVRGRILNARCCLVREQVCESRTARCADRAGPCPSVSSAPSSNGWDIVNLVGVGNGGRAPSLANETILRAKLRFFAMAVVVGEG